MIRYIVISILLSGFLFSCTTDEPEVIDQAIEFKNIGDLDGLERGDCFNFVYPLTYIMPDGSTITIENEEGQGELRNWYLSNPRISERPAFQYPLQIISSEGVSESINNNEELRVAYTACEEEDCFELIYPVVYIMPDGSLIPVDMEGSTGEFTRWYNENPGVEEQPVLQYPVEIILQDGTTANISTHSQMLEIIAACE